jgi:hypothetical protein
MDRRNESSKVQIDLRLDQQEKYGSNASSNECIKIADGLCTWFVPDVNVISAN